MPNVARVPPGRGPPASKQVMKRAVKGVGKKISKLKDKTKSCDRNTAKKYRYMQIRASLKRQIKGKPANLKPLSARQKKRIGALASYNRKYLGDGRR